MIEKHGTGDRILGELVLQLGRVANGGGFIGGLTPAQWTALRYFARANRFSRTVSAFAEYHATTRGTASQTVKSLVAQCYIVRTRSDADGRSARLDLTNQARAILADDPFEALVRAARALPPSARGHLANALERMLGYVALERCKRPFGMCASCEHLEGDGCCREETPPYVCGFVGERLEGPELEQLCINFEPRRNSAMKGIFAEERPQ